MQASHLITRPLPRLFTAAVAGLGVVTAGTVLGATHTGGAPARPAARTSLAAVPSPAPVQSPSPPPPSPSPKPALVAEHPVTDIQPAYRPVYHPAVPQRAYPRVAVPRVGIDLPIIEGDGNAPPFYVAAHLPGTSEPGDSGNSYLYAHDRRGMFLNLHYAQVGDMVYLELSADQAIVYTISEIHQYVNQSDFSYAQQTSDDRLTLQTCNWPDNQDKRFIVIAERAG